jgi:hypothetical protein
VAVDEEMVCSRELLRKVMDRKVSMPTVNGQCTEWHFKLPQLTHAAKVAAVHGVPQSGPCRSFRPTVESTLKPGTHCSDSNDSISNLPKEQMSGAVNNVSPALRRSSGLNGAELV